jgi:hypothetical protein
VILFTGVLDVVLLLLILFLYWIVPEFLRLEVVASIKHLNRTLVARELLRLFLVGVIFCCNGLGFHLFRLCDTTATSNPEYLLEDFLFPPHLLLIFQHLLFLLQILYFAHLLLNIHLQKEIFLPRGFSLLAS